MSGNRQTYGKRRDGLLLVISEQLFPSRLRTPTAAVREIPAFPAPQQRARRHSKNFGLTNQMHLVAWFQISTGKRPHAPRRAYEPGQHAGQRFGKQTRRRVFSKATDAASTDTLNRKPDRVGFQVEMSFSGRKGGIFGLVSGIAIEIELADEHRRCSHSAGQRNHPALRHWSIELKSKGQRHRAAAERNGTLAARRHHEGGAETTDLKHRRFSPRKTLNTAVQTAVQMSKHD